MRHLLALLALLAPAAGAAADVPFPDAPAEAAAAMALAPGAELELGWERGFVPGDGEEKLLSGALALESPLATFTAGVADDAPVLGLGWTLGRWTHGFEVSSLDDPSERTAEITTGVELARGPWSLRLGSAFARGAGGNELRSGAALEWSFAPGAAVELGWTGVPDARGEQTLGFRLRWTNRSPARSVTRAR